MTMRLSPNWVAVAWLVACSSSCFTATLQPRITLEGRQFDITKAASVRVGLSEASVRSLLGAPLESTVDGPIVVWRYYERFTPRGCNPPTLSQEMRVTFRDRVVTSSESTPPAKWP